MENKKWLIAVSGGPDSMALVHLMQKAGIKVGVAHVNYHQRSESNQEASMVKAYCLRHELPFYSKDYDINPSGNFQASAREFRYQFFKDIIEQENYDGVMVGHHYNDHIETYLMQKERGHQTENIGLSEQTIIKDVCVFRPLLKYTKQDLIKICVENDIPYSLDASNDDTKYTRNRIRQEVQDLPTIESAMSEDIKLREAHLNYLKAMVEDLGYIKLARQDYLNYSKGLRLDYLRSCLKHYGVEVFHLRHKYFNELDRQIKSGNVRVEFDKINLYVDFESIVFLKPKPFRVVLEQFELIEHERFKLSSVGNKIQGLKLTAEDFPIVIRNAQPGDRLQMPYGSKKVSRYLIDEKVPRYLRESWVVIENAMKECIFVVGMGCDVHHYANNSSMFVIELNLL